MASHKKHPVFLRIITSNSAVVCINPLQLSSFQILEKATIKVKDKPEPIIADTIRFYFPNGTGLSYSVGLDFSQEEFNYVCATLLEYLYLNEPEFRAKSEKIEHDRIAAWEARNIAPSEEDVTEQPVAAEGTVA